ncbi:hypothetical protein PoB_006181300 [Plakobranchus ocellatus]|uniref:Uncharacterized protein n=1 Tax=Plakobranchus ocellatus TaxID=259542 RepID=A0AAV4CTP8_9GAST|nr:hypothetical protein PoB_006181300 [Plakobranchus ocellatus]
MWRHPANHSLPCSKHISVKMARENGAPIVREKPLKRKTVGRKRGKREKKKLEPIGEILFPSQEPIIFFFRNNWEGKDGVSRRLAQAKDSGSENRGPNEHASQGFVPEANRDPHEHVSQDFVPEANTGPNEHASEQSLFI